MNPFTKRVYREETINNNFLMYKKYNAINVVTFETTYVRSNAVNHGTVSKKESSCDYKHANFNTEDYEPIVKHHNSRKTYWGNSTVKLV